MKNKVEPIILRRAQKERKLLIGTKLQKQCMRKIWRQKEILQYEYLAINDELRLIHDK
tara:strand:- start:3631 stop:3804 length:174 start_codon:yes stop_codon:yes gene_type:complete